MTKFKNEITGKKRPHFKAKVKTNQKIKKARKNAYVVISISKETKQKVCIDFINYFYFKYLELKPCF